MNKAKYRLSKSEIIDELPMACADELAAVELFEKQRWGDTPCCVHCGSVDVYKMRDRKTGGRNKRFLWRCLDCGALFLMNRIRFAMAPDPDMPKLTGTR